MAASDLPVELWLQILSLLPASYVRKTMGLSRTLYEIAMDDIYQHIQLISSDKNTMRTLRQLKYPHISNRVRHIYVWPSFFPIMKERKPKTCLSFLETTLSTLVEPGHSPSRVLGIARSAFMCCPRVIEMTLVLHDLTIISSFHIFLQDMFGHLGKTLRKLSIDVTLAHLPIILDSGISRHLNCLVELDVCLAASRHSSLTPATLAKNLLSFVAALNGNLESLSLSSHELLDLTPFFDGIGRLPHLRHVGLSITMNSRTLSDPSALTRFLLKQKTTLQHFSMRVRCTFQLFNPSDTSYGVWVREEFSKIDLPCLHTLEISLREVYREVHPPRSIIVDLSRFSQLVSLTILDAILTYEETREILQSLSPLNTLRFLRLRVLGLSPRLVDLLATSTPQLKALDMVFTYLNFSGEAGFELPVECIDQYKAFRKDMRTRYYPSWNLEHLKIAKFSYACGHGHYQSQCTRIVDECLPLPAEFDDENECLCPKPLQIPLFF